MSDDLLQVLKRTFGYDSFRPLQREIIEASLAGRDVAAVLPTGAGKSLCFQVPALVRRGVTLVISPLIALMKDQVDALAGHGVAATVLNSSVAWEEARRREEGLERGAYRLLYVAPERLGSGDFVERLRGWGVSAVAVDEAHCISQWGHDFRPEYRQLARLREVLPEVPVMALTATATSQVREDIARQLRLREPAEFLASFNRPNLRYAVIPKRSAEKQLRELVAARGGESGIVYARSRKSVEGHAAALVRAGVRAVAYHAGMSAEERAASQEAFVRDEVEVVCATVAFGMGIDKPNVRYVVHADMPKNIEGYYQETGRAGRDGLPSDCVMLFSAGDVVGARRMLGRDGGEEVYRAALAQLEEMEAYAGGVECRRARLLAYFGERWEGGNCGGCDICEEPPEAWDATVEVQKLLSCVLRIRQKSGFSMGLGHVVEVLVGANTEKIRRWGHDTLSTYGIGKETARANWMMLGRQLQREGLLDHDAAGHGAVTVTEVGLETLRSRAQVMLKRPPAVKGGGSRKDKGRAGEIACDEGLFEQLRLLRRALADARGVPAYQVFGDGTLRHIARRYPTSPDALLLVPGVGQQKLADYGEIFIDEVRRWLDDHEAIPFEAGDGSGSDDETSEVVEVLGPDALGASAEVSLALFQGGLSVEAVAERRELKPSTVHSHLCEAIACGALEADPRAYYSAEEEAELRAAADKVGLRSLGALRNETGGRFDYVTLGYFRAIAGLGRPS